jgi:hypothetical protein
LIKKHKSGRGQQFPKQLYVNGLLYLLTGYDEQAMRELRTLGFLTGHLGSVFFHNDWLTVLLEGLLVLPEKIPWYCIYILGLHNNLV